MVESLDASARVGSAHDAQWRRLVSPADYVNPSPRERYHLVVIGAGPAGLVTAIAAAGLGARVALVERHAMGGDCLNVGCVPSKSLLEFTAARGGQASFDDAFDWLRAVRARIAAHDSVERFVEAGVDVFLGTARFVDDKHVRVGDAELNARRFVVATGARAALPPIPGLAESKPLTNETVFDLTSRPKRLAIIGAGPIGCELALAFARMQVDVLLLEAAERVLGAEIPEAGRAVADALTRHGVDIRLGVSIDKIERRGQKHVAVICGGEETVVDEVLVAAGRRANTDDLNLAAAGVDTDAKGQIAVDRFLRSSNTRIFAAGDVCATLQFTHTADAHARIVVQNALFAPSATTTRLVIPRCTYTDPEVACVGPTRCELERDGVPFDVHGLAFDDLDRGKTQGDDVGFVEVLTMRGSGKILGATIVGRDAGEQIAPLCVGIAHGIGLGGLGKAILPYPTRAEYLRRLADNFNRGKLTPTMKRVFAAWFRWSGRG
jgi:pyruvate/2-oxoglutarate dehydrogenase complex dihydrolipoamide dehydrogenase (E3) component